MHNRLLAILFILAGVASSASAQTWDYIISSGEYYYGTGTGKSVGEADNAALSDLVSMIATNVSSHFQMETDQVSHNGEIDHTSYVKDCVNTYSSSALTNVEKRVEGEGTEMVTVRRFMQRSELAKIYEKRINKIRDMVDIADGALADAKIDMALQYYYWAYSLVRSLQHPSDAKDAEGHSLMVQLPVKMRSILSDISVKYEKSDGEFVDLLFFYKNRPLSSLDFEYNDGSVDCDGSAKDGRGTLQMIPGYETEFYHIDIEYEYKNLARGDDELRAVLDVVQKSVFPGAAITVKADAAPAPAAALASAASPASASTNHSSSSTDAALSAASAPSLSAATHSPSAASATNAAAVGKPLSSPTASQTVSDPTEYAAVMDQVLGAIKSRNYVQAKDCFTLDGLDVYNKLISYGVGRVVGEPSFKYYKSFNGQVVVRGLQMSFMFRNNGRKKTFVEDVVFAFDENKKIYNLAFGLGDVAEADILHKKASGWKDDTRELITEFLENYKTAFCLERLDYIRDIFSDDAVIFVGNVVKRVPSTLPEGRQISQDGQDIIRYNRYDKTTYISNLSRTFKQNDFINIRFTNNEVQWLNKFENEQIFGIQIGQEYTSTHYADKGYLFLLVNMTDRNAPQIKVRTWQPNEVSMDNIFNAGHFYNE